MQADLGDDRLGGLPSDAGDLIEAVDRGQHRGALTAPGVQAGAAIGVDALGGRDRGDQFLDPVVSVPIWTDRASIWSSSIRASLA